MGQNVSRKPWVVQESVLGVGQRGGYSDDMLPFRGHESKHHFLFLDSSSTTTQMGIGPAPSFLHFFFFLPQVLLSKPNYLGFNALPGLCVTSLPLPNTPMATHP